MKISLGKQFESLIDGFVYVVEDMHFNPSNKETLIFIRKVNSNESLICLTKEQFIKEFKPL